MTYLFNRQQQFYWNSIKIKAMKKIRRLAIPFLHLLNATIVNSNMKNVVNPIAFWTTIGFFLERGWWLEGEILNPIFVSCVTIFCSIVFSIQTYCYDKRHLRLSTSLLKLNKIRLNFKCFAWNSILKSVLRCLCLKWMRILPIATKYAKVWAAETSSAIKYAHFCSFNLTTFVSGPRLS